MSAFAHVVRSRTWAAVVFSFLTCTAAFAHAATSFILANIVNDQHVQNVAAQSFNAKLKELSGGEIAVQYHPGGDLGDWVQLFEQTMQGAIQMAQVWNASEFDRRLDMATLGYTASTWDECVTTYQPGSVMATFWGGVLDDLNMHLVGILPDGMYGVAVRKGRDAPTRYPDSAKGFKLRVPPIRIGITRFEALGFSAVPMPMSELYTALQLGTVDGAAFQDAPTVAAMADVYGHYVRTNDICGYSFWVANKKWWQGLPQTTQDTITQAANHAVTIAWDTFAKIDADAIAAMQAAGVQVHALAADELATARRIVYDVEWPWAQEQVGQPTMDAIRAALGMR